MANDFHSTRFRRILEQHAGPAPGFRRVIFPLPPEALKAHPCGLPTGGVREGGSERGSKGVARLPAEVAAGSPAALGNEKDGGYRTGRGGGQQSPKRDEEDLDLCALSPGEWALLAQRKGWAVSGVCDA